MPQTWEDPEHTDDSTGCKGDGDPVDVCEIGSTVHERGAVIQVKILGTVALIDEGETDWKVLAIDVNDPKADQINDVHDIEKVMPGLLDATVEWFTIYKIPDGKLKHIFIFNIVDILIGDFFPSLGKPANKFAFNGEPKNRDFTLNVIDKLAEQWKSMMSASEEKKGISRACSVYECSSKTGDGEGAVNAAAAVGEPEAIPKSVDEWHYVKP